MSLLEQFPETKLSSKDESLLRKKGKLTDLVMANMREAVLYARTCSGDKLEEGELVSICYDAMTNTARLFKPGRGTRFFAFSKPRIRGALLRHFNQLTTVRNAECISSDALQEEEQESVAESPPDFDTIDFRERWRQVSDIIARTCTDREAAIMHLVFSLHFTYEEVGSLFQISRAAAQAIAAKVILRIKRAL